MSPVLSSVRASGLLGDICDDSQDLNNEVCKKNVEHLT